MSRRWIMVTVLVGVLALGITGGAVLAQGGGTDGDSSGDSPNRGLASRVAEILGLDEAQVQDAFEQALGELHEEALQRKLDRLVEMGKLAQDQADEYKEWFQSRPEGLSPKLFHGSRGHRFHGGAHYGGSEGPGWETRSSWRHL